MLWISSRILLSWSIGFPSPILICGLCTTEGNAAPRDPPGLEMNGELCLTDRKRSAASVPGRAKVDGALAGLGIAGGADGAGATGGGGSGESGCMGGVGAGALGAVVVSPPVSVTGC